MKKISTLLLLIIGFLFVGMFIPSAHASSTVTLNLKVARAGETTQITSTDFSVTFGNTTSISLSGLLLTEDEIAILIHNGEFIPLNTQILMSGSLNLSIIVKDEETDYVAVFVDTNGEMVDVIYNPVLAPETSVSLTKPGYSSATFDTAVISEDTIFIAQYVKSNESSISVTANGGTMDLLDPEFNDIITVTSTTPGFTHWVDEFGFVVSYQETFKMTVLNNITLTAMTDGTQIPNIYLRDVSGIRENHESFYAKIDLPAGYDLIEWGFIGSNTNANGQYEPILTGEDVAVNPNKSLNTVTNEFLTTMTGEGFAYIRAYATVYNNSTELYETIYSLVRNSIDVTFRINYGWAHNFSDPVLGAYVRSDLNNWGVTQKMNVDQGSNYTNYYLTINHKFIGTSFSYQYKYFIYVPGGWNPGDGWEGPNNINGVDYRYRWYGTGWVEVSPDNWQDPNYMLLINPEFGPSQFSSEEPRYH